MKICSWNLLYTNKTSNKVLRFIRETDYNIYCLQEVPTETVKYLGKLGYNIEHCLDSAIFNSDKTEKDLSHLVILSKPKISKKIVIPHGKKSNTIRGALASYFICGFHMPDLIKTGFNSMYIDVEEKDRKYRVFNSHFKLMQGYKGKVQDFKDLRRNLDHIPIFCGDYNILDTYPVKMLNWANGHNLSEIVLGSERKELDAILEANGLVNHFKGQKTYKSFHTQLDHIITPNFIKIGERKNHSDNLHGSDHHPIMIEVR